MFLTELVLNEERSKESNDEHPENIANIFSALLVSHDKKSIDVKFEHPLNIESIFLQILKF